MVALNLPRMPKHEPIRHLTVLPSIPMFVSG